MRSILINFIVGIGLLLMTFALTGCLIESEKAVLPLQYSTDLGLELGEYSNCMAENSYTDLAKTNECSSLRLLQTKGGALVAIDNKIGYVLVSLKNIEGSLYLLQFNAIKGLSKDYDVISIKPQDPLTHQPQNEKIFYGFVRHIKNENLWQYYIPDGRTFDDNLKIQLSKVAQINFAGDGSVEIKNPSFNNLSKMMKILSNDKKISFAVLGRVSLKK